MLTLETPDLGNRFVATLERDDALRLSPLLQIVALQQGEVIVNHSQAVERVIFPLTALLGVFVTLRDGREVQTLSIGDEGGCHLLQGFASQASRARVAVQVAGSAYQISAAAFKSLLGQSPSLAEHAARFVDAALTEAAAATACAASHSSRRRLCRWLVDAQARTHRNTIPVTQEDLALVLGVQRTTVTALATRLREEGLISYHRGEVMVTNPAGVAKAACECRVDRGERASPASLQVREPAPLWGQRDLSSRLGAREGQATSQ